MRNIFDIHNLLLTKKKRCENMWLLFEELPDGTKCINKRSKSISTTNKQNSNFHSKYFECVKTPSKREFKTPSVK